MRGSFNCTGGSPLKTILLSGLPWQRVVTTLFEWKKGTYLLIVDYFSRWIEIARLDHLSAGTVVTHTKSIIARYGIPEEVYSDNRSHFTSALYADFATEYGFSHFTSSHPREAERAVHTMKHLLQKAGDPYLALLAYRSTLLELGNFPSQPLMGQRLATTLPMAKTLLVPRNPEEREVRNKDSKERPEANRDMYHGATQLADETLSDVMWVLGEETSGKVVTE